MPLKKIDKIPDTGTLIETLSNDDVGRNADITKFLHTLADIEGPFSIFIDSAWGDGKTFFVKALEFVLRLQNPQLEVDVSDDIAETTDAIKQQFPVDEPYLPIYFSAWDNDDFNDPLLPLLATIADACEFKDTKIQESARKKLAGLIDSITRCASFIGSITGIIPPMGAESFGTEQLIESLSSEDFLESYRTRMQLRKKFDLIAETSLSEIANKLVIFVDDLDRCRPTFAVKLLEQTKTLFSHGEVVLAFSTDCTQLAHAIRGLYGASFNSEKYLERFFDMKVNLTPVDSISYLRYLGFNSEETHNYTRVANGYIRMLQPTMRDANRLVEALKRGQKYVQNKHHEGSNDGLFPIYIAEGALLPTFIVMSYDAPEAWHNVLTGKDFSKAYEYAKRNDEFVETVEHLISWGMGPSQQNLITDETAENFIRWICAAIFLKGSNDPRYREARERLCFMWGQFDVQVFKTLAEEY